MKPVRNATAFSSYSIHDRDAARRFYAETLELDVSLADMPEMPEEFRPLELKLADGHIVMLYAKPDHEPATFTVLNFPVPDVEAAVDELVRRGVRFERYGGDIETDRKGIHRAHGVTIAWFRDPAGNVLSVLEQQKGV